MEKVLAIAPVVVPIFFAVFLGILARKKAIFAPEVIQGFQQFVFKIGLPCLIFQSCLTADVNAQAVSCFVLLPPFLLICAIWAFRAGKRLFPYHNTPMLFCCKETGMLGIPLFVLLFGAEQAFRVGVLDLAQAVVVYPILGILSADTQSAASPIAVVKQIVKSPLLILSVLGIALNLTGIWELLSAVGVGQVISESVSFVSQPVSAVILFCVGYNFSITKSNRDVIMKLAAVHFGIYLIVGILIQGLLFLIPGVDALTRWAIALYSVLPASYLAPGLGKNAEESVVASGVCSVLTVVSMAAFCCMAAIIS